MFSNISVYYIFAGREYVQKGFRRRRRRRRRRCRLRFRLLRSLFDIRVYLYHIYHCIKEIINTSCWRIIILLIVISVTRRRNSMLIQQKKKMVAVKDSK